MFISKDLDFREPLQLIRTMKKVTASSTAAPDPVNAPYKKFLPSNFQSSSGVSLLDTVEVKKPVVLPEAVVAVDMEEELEPGIEVVNESSVVLVPWLDSTDVDDGTIVVVSSGRVEVSILESVEAVVEVEVKVEVKVEVEVVIGSLAVVLSTVDSVVDIPGDEVCMLESVEAVVKVEVEVKVVTGSVVVVLCRVDSVVEASGVEVNSVNSVTSLMPNPNPSIFLE